MTGILIEVLRKSIFDPSVWAMPVFLKARITLCWSYNSKTFRTSVSVVFPDPTLIDPPTDIVVGILVTTISTILELVDAVIDCAKLTLSVLTPILKDPAKLTIVVLSPDINAEFRLSNSMNGWYVATTSLLFFHVKIASSKRSSEVSNRLISIPTISLTSALKPDPLVSWLSKFATSPTLYPVPPSKITRLSIPPWVTDSTCVDCLSTSLDSIIKSLSPNFSSTLWGYVFLNKLELLKSKSWFIDKLSSINGDLKLLPIKYGYFDSIWFVVDPNSTVAK